MTDQFLSLPPFIYITEPQPEFPRSSETIELQILSEIVTSPWTDIATAAVLEFADALKPPTR
jgi:hypothetical protein